MQTPPSYRIEKHFYAARRSVRLDFQAMFARWINAPQTPAVESLRLSMSFAILILKTASPGAWSDHDCFDLGLNSTFS
jgi:hypothetical protein